MLAVLLLSIVVAGSALAAEPAWPFAAREITNSTFIAFDTETTGLSRRSDRIVELAAVRFNMHRVLARKRWLLNPGIPIPRFATRVHGITDTMVADKPSFKDIYPAFTNFISDAVLLAHNASFDKAVLSAEAARNGFEPLQNIVVDTLRLSRKFYPKLTSHRLETLVTELKLKRGGAFHRADADAEYVRLVFLTTFTNFSPTATMIDMKPFSQ